MKKQTLIVASLFFVVGLTVIPANAQEFDAKVPFSFIVSGKTIPAGDYTITISNLLRITNGDGRLVALAFVYDASGRPDGEKSQIIFHCYGDRCFLAQVWSAHQGNGRELMTSPAEAKVAKEKSGKYFAVMGEEPLKRR